MWDADDDCCERRYDKSLHGGFLASSLSCSGQHTHPPNPSQYIFLGFSDSYQNLRNHTDWKLKNKQSQLSIEILTKETPGNLCHIWNDFDFKINPRCTSEHPCTHGEGHCTADSECERNGYHVCGASCIGGWTCFQHEAAFLTSTKCRTNIWHETLSQQHWHQVLLIRYVLCTKVRIFILVTFILCSTPQGNNGTDQ